MTVAADPIVKSATLYAALTIIRAVVDPGDGTTQEQDWPVSADGLPPIELPSGRAIRAFTAAGGVIATGSGIPAVANYVATPIKVSAGEPVSAQGGSPPSLPDVDPRQFFQALVQLDRITQADCLSYLQVGTLPPPLAVAVNALPAAEQFSATCLLVGAQSFMRDNPIVPLIGAELSPPMASADLDALWTLAASL